MKAVYSKPELEVITFELMEAVASCSSQVYQNHEEGGCAPTLLGSLLVGKGFDFTADKSSCTNPADDFCYYTYSQNEEHGLLFNS